MNSLVNCFLFVVIVHKPEKVSWTEAAGAIRDGVRACTALYYLSHLSPGKSVLIMDGASVSPVDFVFIPVHHKHRNYGKAVSVDVLLCHSVVRFLFHFTLIDSFYQ